MPREKFEKADLSLSSGVSRKLIVDNDCGVDDAWGLSLLLKLAQNHTILGITCVKGNTDLDNVCRNNLYLLSVLERKEIPVYRGAKGPLLSLAKEGMSQDLEYFHGKNGFGDVPLPKLADQPEIQDENAIVALNRITSENKGQVTLVCFAPLTNIALAIRTYPDFVNNVKDIFIMGGNYQGVGNTTSCAEFNFHVDPEAASIVLKEMQNKVHLLPWETCITTRLPFEWRETLLTDCGPVCQFLNTIERPIMERGKRLGFKNYVSADQLLAAVLINPSIVTNAFRAHACVELSGAFTRGQVILDHLNSKPFDLAVVISEIDPNQYFSVVNSIKSL